MANKICFLNKILNSHSPWESGDERQQKEEKECEKKDKEEGALHFVFVVLPGTHGPSSVPKCHKHYLIPPTIL